MVADAAGLAGWWREAFLWPRLDLLPKELLPGDGVKPACSHSSQNCLKEQVKEVEILSEGDNIKK